MASLKGDFTYRLGFAHQMVGVPFKRKRVFSGVLFLPTVHKPQEIVVERVSEEG